VGATTAITDAFVESITVFTEKWQKTGCETLHFPAADNPLPLLPSAVFIHGNSCVKSGVL